MRLLFIAARWNPQDPDSGSGVDYNVYMTLKNKVDKIEIAGPFSSNLNLIESGIRKVAGLISKKRLIKFYPSYLKQSNQVVQQKIQSFQPHVIFSKSSVPLVNVQLSTPLVYMCDSSVAWTKKEWPEFSNLGYAIMQYWERKVIDKASHIITFSNASAQMLRDFYHKPTKQITVHPIPSSLPKHLCTYQEKPFGQGQTLKLVLVGKVYKRKGVDIAIDATHQLNTSGIPTQIRVIGQEGPSSDDVKFMGLYSKKDPDGLNQYIDNYRWANFQIFPSRFDTAGIVPSEAAGFGVPTITNAAGGLATTVKHKVSGIVLPKNSPASDYVDVIKTYWHDPDRYHALCTSTYERYQSELTWDSLGKKLIGIINNLAKHQDG
ncbi:MAG: glycosyltransferase family 4 protein [Anaerolineales bacterium]